MCEQIAGAECQMLCLFRHNDDAMRSGQQPRLPMHSLSVLANALSCALVIATHWLAIAAVVEADCGARGWLHTVCLSIKGL